MEKASYRVIILKRRFPDLTRKNNVRNAVKCTLLTLIDSEVLQQDLGSQFTDEADQDVVALGFILNLWMFQSLLNMPSAKLPAQSRMSTLMVV